MASWTIGHHGHDKYGGYDGDVEMDMDMGTDINMDINRDINMDMDVDVDNDVLVLEIGFGPPTADFGSIWSSQTPRKF